MRARTIITLAALALAACQTTRVEPPVTFVEFEERAEEFTCRELGAMHRRSTELLREAYSQQKGIEGGQKAGAAVALIPVVGLVAAAGTIGLSLAKADTRDLRSFSDQVQVEIFDRLLGGTCERPGNVRRAGL